MNTMRYPGGSKSGKMNGRMYDPVVSRFISPDPFIQSPYQSESFNRYSYCMNNPMRFTDPSGYYAAPSDRPLKMSMQEIQEKIQRERSEWMQELDQVYGRGYGGTSGMSSNSNITIYSGGLPVLSGVVGEIGAGLLKSYTDISGIGVEFNQQTGEIMMHTTHVYSVGEWVKLGDKYWELNTTVVENVTRSLADVMGNMNNNGSGEGNGLGNTANNINTGIGVGSGLFAGNYGMTANQIIRYAERIKGEVVSAAELTAAHTAQSMKMANALGRLNIVTGTLGSAYSTGKVISDYNSGGWQNVNGLDVADAAIGWGGVGVGVLATIGIVSNPVGWVVGIGTGIYFGARLIYDISQD